MRPLFSRWMLLTAALVALGFAVPAQSQSLASGTRVRVTTGETATVGHVASSSPDSLILVRRDARPAGFTWNEVGRIEQSHGRRGRPGRGALIGAGVMTALTVSTIVFGDSGDEYGEDWGATIAVIALPVNAAFGAGAGALIGLAWRTERWTPLPFARSAN